MVDGVVGLEGVAIHSEGILSEFPLRERESLRPVRIVYEYDNYDVTRTKHDKGQISDAGS